MHSHSCTCLLLYESKRGGTGEGRKLFDEFVIVRLEEMLASGLGKDWSPKGGRSGGNVHETEMDLASNDIRGLGMKTVAREKVGTTLIWRLTTA